MRAGIATSLAFAVALSTACSTPRADDRGAARSSAPINATCPRSGEPVALDSLTEYRGHVVGFCNPHCRDDFAANVAERPRDRAHFDALLAAPERTGGT